MISFSLLFEKDGRTIGERGGQKRREADWEIAFTDELWTGGFEGWWIDW